MNSLNSIAFIVTLLCLKSSLLYADQALAFFADGDRISGNLLSTKTIETLSWSSDYLSDPAKLNTKSLLEIKLPNDPANASDSGKATINLTNGDTLIGNIQSLDEKSLTISSSVFDSLTIKRGMIRFISLQEPPTRLYSGPVDKEDWETTNHSWKFLHRSLIANSGHRGATSRNFETPDRFHFSFTANWKNRLNMRLRFLSDSIEPEKLKNYYSLHLNNQHADIRKTIDDGSNIDQRLSSRFVSIPDIAQKELAHFDLYVDRREGKIILKVDGKLYGDWNDVDLLDERFGNTFSFSSEGQNLTGISEIQMRSWPLNYREIDLAKIEPLIPREAINEHYIVLANGDLIRGQILKAENDQLTIDSQNLPISIPMERIHYIKLSPVPYDEAKREKGDIRAYYNNSQYITFRLEEIVDGKLKGYSQAFGQSEFEAAAFTKLSFNIYNFKYRNLKTSPLW